jgi:hypothetical protein
MLPLALVLEIRLATGSYRSAGAGLAAFAIISSVLAPWRGRIIDRRGSSALLVFASAYGTALCVIGALGIAGAASFALIALSGIAGAVVPPVAAFARARIGASYRGEPQLEPAFALDSALGELTLVTGPALVGGLVFLGGGVLAISATAGAAVLGSLGLRLGPPLWNARTADTDVHNDEEPARLGQLVAPFACLAALGVALGIVDVAVPGFAQQHAEVGLSGVLLAALAVGSTLGGLIAGLARSKRPLPFRYAAATTLFAASLAVIAYAASSIGAMAALLFAAGLTLQPSMIALYLLLDHATAGRRATEVFALVTTFNNGGLALGSLLAGSLIQSHDVRDAFAAAAGAAVIGAVIAGAHARFGGWSRPPALPESPKATR